MFYGLFYLKLYQSISNKRMSGWFVLLQCFIELPVLNSNNVDPDQMPVMRRMILVYNVYPRLCYWTLVHVCVCVCFCFCFFLFVFFVVVFFVPLSKDSDLPVHSPGKEMILVYPSLDSPEAATDTCNHRILWSDCGNVQAFLRLHWWHKSYCRVCCALAQLLIVCNVNLDRSNV